MFRGSFPALVTPFQENLDIDFDAYGRLIDFQIENGTHGIVPCGCTGEAATMSHDEQKSVIKFAVERVAGRIPVVAGTGSNYTKEAVELTAYAKDVGADGALLITPYYNKPTPAGQVAHYNAVANAVDIPIMLYNVPSRTGTKMSPETIAELNKTANIVSVKEACGSVEQVSDIHALCDINIMSGDDPLTLGMMAVGAEGVVSVTANIMPRQVSSMIDAFHAGDLDKARELHYEILPVSKSLFIESNPIPVKAALTEMGMIKNVLRLPLTPILPEKLEILRAALKKAGLV